MQTMLTDPMTDDELTMLQLRVARRADALAARAEYLAMDDRRVWLRAEFEIFELVERACPTLLVAAG